MKLKTFLITYLLLLFILFASLSIVSAYLANSQMNVLKEKCASEYQTIATSLAKDISVLAGRSVNLSEDVSSLVNGYVRYYRKNNITIELIELPPVIKDNETFVDTELTFLSREQEYFIFITGALRGSSQLYQLNYYYNATTNIAEMRTIQNTLLFIFIAFSVISAFALHFILSIVFYPLSTVAKASKNIADGHYDERIHIRAKNELSEVAEDFNRMAEEIQKQIRLLENEADGKQQFVDNFSHEIRTPLTSIYGYAEYMQRASLNEEEIIDSTQFIMNEASRIKKIANSLLELATLRGYTAVKSKISIPQLFDDLSQTMKKSLHEQSVRLVCHSEVQHLEGQEDLIKSMLLNLCFNALNACYGNDGIIRLEAMEQGEHTILSVQDNGCGIPEESISRVMEPFYRADKVRSREHGGAGLGLSLCRQIAEAHNAKIYIESVEGTGTTIKVTFTSSK